jgi:hypothetical protein
MTKATVRPESTYHLGDDFDFAVTPCSPGIAEETLSLADARCRPRAKSRSILGSKKANNCTSVVWNLQNHAELRVEKTKKHLICRDNLDWSGRRESNPRMQLGKLPHSGSPPLESGGSGKALFIGFFRISAKAGVANGLSLPLAFDLAPFAMLSGRPAAILPINCARRVC